MPVRINPTQMASVTTWKGGVTKENHIYGLFRSEPQKASKVMITLLANERLPSLDTYLSKEVPVKEFEDDTKIFWDVVMNKKRNVSLVEARRADGTPVAAANEGNVGVGYEPFYLIFDEDLFFRGEVLWGNFNEMYPVIVKEDPVQEGTRTKYFVEPYGAGMADGIPAERLLPGELFSWGYAPIERNFSRQVGGVRYSNFVSVSAEWMRIRMHDKIGGEEIGRYLSANFPVNVNGTVKMASRWMLVATWELEKQWEEYKSNTLDSGVSTIMENGEVSNIGLSGNPNRQGSGYNELISYGHQEYYNTFSIKLIEDAIADISFGKIDFKKRKFMVRTGERGLIQASKACKAEMSGWIPLYGGTSNVPYIKGGANTDYTQNGVSVTDFQVTKWLSSNGLEVEFVLDSSRDNPDKYKIPHPLGGPAESYRYDIIYAADENEPNLQKCVAKNSPERRGYQWGPFGNPYDGSVNNMHASYDEDAAEVHYKATFGLKLADPTRVYSLIPNILRG